MKKFALSLIACLAFGQATYAATSALTESLLEYQAITSAIGTNPTFENVIGPNEFIIDIKRVTHQVDVLGQVKYEIVTRVIRGIETAREAAIEQEILEKHSSGSHHRNKRHRMNTYIATLNVTANPGIGPNIITVVNIKKVNSQTHIFFEDELTQEDLQ